MTKPWKSKRNSSNILLVLVTLILIKAECTTGENDDVWEEENNSIDKPSNESSAEIYVGNDDIAQFFFQSSAQNNSLILEDINKCLDSFQLVTCLKMLLLDRLNNAMKFLESPSVTNSDLYFLRGLLVFKRKNESEIAKENEKSEDLSLDKEITVKVLKMFENRSLQVNLLPRVKVEIQPTAGEKVEDFICFKYKFYQEDKFTENGEDNLEEGRKKKGGMPMMMILPQLLMLGFLPFTLASLKAMVMNAVMINMMALNGAIFMTIRNLVFGPRKGSNVKYVNYGYSKNRQTQSPKPVLIIHSPAAFVKQPPVHKKPIRRPPPSSEVLIWDPETNKGHFVKNTHHNFGNDGYFSHTPEHLVGHYDHSYQFSGNGDNSFNHPQLSSHYSHQNTGGNDFHIVPENEIGSYSHHHEYGRRNTTIQRRNDNSVSNKQVGGNNSRRSSHQRNRNANQSQAFSSYSRSPYTPSPFREGFLQSKANLKAVKDTEFRPSPQWDPMEQLLPSQNSTNSITVSV